MPKETFLEMAQRHYAADNMLRKGEFEWDGKSACSVGCFNHELGNSAGDFDALADFSGYPVWAHQIQEDLFEGLPEPDNQFWHVQFAEKCCKIKDWTSAYHKMMVAILMVALPFDKSEGKVVQRVIDLRNRGPEVTDVEWSAARAAAWDAARAAARDAVGVAARAAARAAAGAAARDAAGMLRGMLRGMLHTPLCAMHSCLLKARHDPPPAQRTQPIRSKTGPRARAR